MAPRGSRGLGRGKNVARGSQAPSPSPWTNVDPSKVSKTAMQYMEEERQKKEKKRKRAENEEVNVHVADAGKTESDKYKEALPDLETARDNAIATLKAGSKYNAPLARYGCYIVNVGQSTSKQTTIAGYLNQENTLALHRKTASGTEVGKQLEWLYGQATKAFFGLVLKTSAEGIPYAPRFDPAALFKHLFDGHFFHDDVKNFDEPSVKRYDPTSSTYTRMYLFYLRSAYVVVPLLKGDVFTGPAPGAPSRQFVDGVFEAEDIMRFITLYNFYKTVKTKNQKESQKSGGQSQLPELPIFCLPGDASTNTTAQSARNRIALGRLLSTDITGNELFKDFSAGPDDFEGEGKDQHFSVAHSVSLRREIPEFDRGQREKVIERLASQCQYLYRSRAKANQFFTPRAVDIDEERQAQKKATLADQAFADNRDIVAEDGDIAAAKKEFIQLQKLLNHRTARPPEWDAACELLQLEVEELGTDVNKLTKQNFKILYRGLELLPWQPQAAAFCCQMIEGPLKACINSDDTGLGKTVTTLVVIVERSIRIAEARRAWIVRRRNLMRNYREKLEDDDAPISEPSDLDEGEGLTGSDDRFLRMHGYEEIFEEECGPEPIHKPVLICVTPSAIGAWRNDTARFFDSVPDRRNITLRTRYSIQGNQASIKDRESEVGRTAAQMQKFIDSLPPDKESTSRTVILCTYQSWQRTVLDSHVPGTRLVPSAGGSSLSPAVSRKPAVGSSSSPTTDPNGALRIDEDDEDDEFDEFDDGDDGDDGEDDENGEDGADGERPDETQACIYVQLKIRADSFGLVVLDEAHRVKNAASLQTEAVYKLADCQYILVTATPYINTVRDFYGLLRFLWKSVHKSMFEDFTGPWPNRASFRDMFIHFEQKYELDLFRIPQIEQGSFFSALNPALFLSLVTLSSGAVDIEVGKVVIPLPATLTTIRRVMGQTIQVAGRSVELGKGIPHYNVTTIEVRMGFHEASLYRAVHESCTSGNDAGGLTLLGADDPVDDARPINLRRRRLQHASLNPQLEQFHLRKASTDAKAVQSLLKQGLDSFEFYHTWTKGDLHHPTPNDRIQMAQYLVAPSAKLQALLGLILDVVIRGHHKLCIYADWPLNLWLLELTLTVLQINFRSIRAGVVTSKRLDAEREYNENPQVQVLVCSSRSAAESLNLQKGGHHIAVMDCVGINVLSQIIGRAFRVGQEHVQEIAVFVTDETYDQAIQALNQQRYRVQVSATAKVDFASLSSFKYFDKMRKKLEQEMDQVVDPTTYHQAVRNAVRQAYINAMIRQLLGLRSDRHEWTVIKDPGAKNMLPMERIFRLATGGDVARELLARVRASAEPKEKGRLNRVGPDEPAPTPVQQLTPFSAKVLPREAPDERQFREVEYVDELIKAAREISQGMEYMLHDFGPEVILRAALRWTDNPSSHVKLALQRLGGKVDGPVFLPHEFAADSDTAVTLAPGDGDASASRPPRSHPSDTGSPANVLPGLASDVEPPSSPSPAQRDEQPPPHKRRQLTFHPAGRLKDETAGGSGTEEGERTPGQPVPVSQDPLPGSPDAPQPAATPDTAMVDAYPPVASSEPSHGDGTTAAPPQEPSADRPIPGEATSSADPSKPNAGDVTTAAPLQEPNADHPTASGATPSTGTQVAQGASGRESRRQTGTGPQSLDDLDAEQQDRLAEITAVVSTFRSADMVKEFCINEMEFSPAGKKHTRAELNGIAAFKWLQEEIKQGSTFSSPATAPYMK